MLSLQSLRRWPILPLMSNYEVARACSLQKDVISTDVLVAQVANVAVSQIYRDLHLPFPTVRSSSYHGHTVICMCGKFKQHLYYTTKSCNNAQNMTTKLKVCTRNRTHAELQRASQFALLRKFWTKAHSVSTFTKHGCSIWFSKLVHVTGLHTSSSWANCESNATLSYLQIWLMRPLISALLLHIGGNSCSYRMHDGPDSQSCECVDM